MTMKEISTIKLSNARNAEHYQFHADVNAAVTAEFAEAQGIGELREAYAALFADEDKAYALSRGLATTADVESLDAARDQWARYIFQTIEAKRISPLDEEREAAERLRVELSAYWNCHSLPYAENTAAVANMTADMQADSLKDDVAAIGLTAATSQLRQANDDFNTAYAGRSSEKLEREASDNMKTVRPKVDEAYRDLVKAINALYTVNALVAKDEAAEAALGGVIDSVNALVLQLDETISKRTAKSASKSKKQSAAAATASETEE